MGKRVEDLDRRIAPLRDKGMSVPAATAKAFAQIAKERRDQAEKGGK